MPRKPHEPAPPGAAAELGRALEASDFDMASLFVEPRGLADPGVIADAAVIKCPRPSRSHPVPAEQRPVHPDDGFSEAMRRHLNEVNRRLIGLGAGLDAVDTNMAAAISEHLDAICLDDIRTGIA